jgi:hypothetical protein
MLKDCKREKIVLHVSKLLREQPTHSLKRE